MRKLIIICGPTAVGKTQVGMQLAAGFNGEIISADSQQVWRGFDVGTAKANLTERSDIPHHLIDICEPTEHFDAERFVKLADGAIADIAGRGKVPIIVGGTGMYIRMLERGLCDAPPRDARFRKKLELEIESDGLWNLHDRLKEIDPESASAIHPNDHTRIVRALEIHHLADIPASEFRKKHSFAERRYDALKFGLTIDREELYRRIDERVDRMIENGLVDEVRSLLARHSAECQPFQAVGYREIVAHLNGRMNLEEAVRLTKRNSRHFAKRQLTWFRADPEIEWFSPDDLDAIAGAVREFMTVRPLPINS